MKTIFKKINYRKVKRQIEVFSAGCPVCEEQINKIKKEACKDDEIVILDIRSDKEALKRSKSYRIKSVPGVVIDGVLAECCWKSGIDIEVLKSMGLGKQN